MPKIEYVETPFRVVMERVPKDGDKTSPLEALQDERKETKEILLALADFRCEKCGSLLQESKCYFCCRRVHCPFCGREIRPRHLFLAGWQGSYCEHLLVAHGELAQGSRRRCFFWPVEMMNYEDRQQWRQRMNLMPPALRLSGQKTKGYPRWSEQQKSLCFPPQLLPMLKPLFGYDLRQSLANRDAEVIFCLLDFVLRPPVSIFLYDDRMLPMLFWFSLDAQSAMEKVEHVVNSLAEGTRKLREMPPEKIIIRPVRKLRATDRWEAQQNA